jgi:hypothetical protein
MVPRHCHLGVHQLERCRPRARAEQLFAIAQDDREVPNAFGLAGAAALHILCKRQSAFARGIVAFAFAHTIAGDHRSPFDDIASPIRLNRIDYEELSAKVREEIAPFATPGASSCARAAAACALRLLGLLDGQIDAEQLSLPPTPTVRHSGEPTIDPLNPSAERPEGIEGISTKVHAMDPAVIWNHMSRTFEDNELEWAWNFLARFDPGGLAAFLNRVAETVASRSGMPLRQLAWHLPWLSPILSEDAVAAILRMIGEIGRDPSLVPAGDQDFVTGMMVEGVFPHLDAGAQLDLLQSLPTEARFYLRYSALAKPLPAADAERRLGDALFDHLRIIERTLLFLAATAGEMTDGLRDHVITCLTGNDTEAQAAAAELARNREDAVLDDAVLALPLPEDDDRTWRTAALRSAFASAVARRNQDDLVGGIPVEHLDWVTARLPAARGRFAETIEATIDRLVRPVLSDEPSYAVVVLQVSDDPTETRIDLVDRGENIDDPIAAINAELGDDTGARFARRRQLLHDQLERFLTERFLREKVMPQAPAERIDVFISPYYGLAIERMRQAIKPDASAGEAPELPAIEANRPSGTTGEVDFWTSREVRPVIKSHVNYVVADTKQWEQSAAYFIDTHDSVDAFVKNAGLGFAIPYLHNGQMHDYEPDFIVRLRGEAPGHVILETKGYDPLKDVKRQAAQRWVAAVNADGRFGQWRYELIENPSEVSARLTAN